MPADIVVESINDHQRGELIRLKAWIFRQRIKVRMERDRAERRQKNKDESARSKTEQPVLFKF